MKVLLTIVFPALVIGCACLHAARAAEINLPAIGTNINYDYFLATPEFVVADNGPSEQLIQADTTFAANKHLFIDFEPSAPIIQIDLRLNAPGLMNLFAPPGIGSYNEQMSLLLENGQATAPVNNTGVGYFLDNVDDYDFSWTFHPLADFDLYGLQWTISPDLIAGASLPSEMSLRFDIFASGSVWVVPEPSSVALMALAVAMLAQRWRHRA